MLGMVEEVCLIPDGNAKPLNVGEAWEPQLSQNEFGAWMARVSRYPSHCLLIRALYPVPGQALGELLLELWGEAPKEGDE
jgi:hypothetical protein